MTASKHLAAAARRLADQVSEKAAALPAGFGLGIATVTTVTAGGASDGNALVKVTYRGRETPAAGYLAAYTPAVGHRVLYLSVFAQLIVLGRVVGRP